MALGSNTTQFYTKHAMAGHLKVQNAKVKELILILLKQIMMRYFFPFLFLLLTLGVAGQIKKKCPYIISKFRITEKVSQSKTKLVFKFIGPTNEPVKSHVAFTINNDSIFPSVDSSGKYTMFMNPGKYKLKFFVPFWHEVVIDSTSFRKNEQVNITIRFKAKDFKLPDIKYDLGKPAIYLYPQSPTKVNLKLDVHGAMTFSYPKYTKGWTVMANPSGNLNVGNRNYGYLFWEGSKIMNDLPINWTEGFVVKSDTLVNFFENALAKAGLNEKETQDFITYWVPKMQANAYNYIHFMFNKEYDYFANITIDPIPDNLIRVFVLWSNSNEPERYPVTEQKFPHYDRNGFTVIEWGGSEIDKALHHIE